VIVLLSAVQASPPPPPPFNEGGRGAGEELDVGSVGPTANGGRTPGRGGRGAACCVGERAGVRGGEAEAACGVAVRLPLP
jgi:hypothetical protein